MLQSSHSLTLQILLSDIGAIPVLTVIMNTTRTLDNQLIKSTERIGRFSRGKLLDPVLVSGLQPNTNYSFTAMATNFGGAGTPSMEFTFTTGLYME